MSATIVAKGTIYIAAQNILTSVMAIVFYVVMARFLTPSDVGAISALQFAIAIYSTFAILALQNTATKYLSEEIGRGRPKVAAAVAKQTLRMVAISSLLILFPAILFSPSLASSLLGDPSKSLIFMIAFVSAFFGILKQMYLSFLQGVQRLDLFAKIHIVTVLVSSGLAVIAVIFGYGLIGVVSAWLASQITGFILSALFYKGLLPGSSVIGYPISKLFRFATPLFLLGLIGIVVNWSDRMIFLAFTGSLSDLGIYELSVRGSMILTIIPSAVGIAILPAFSELYGRTGKEGMSRAVRLSTRYLAYLIFPAAFGLAATSETAIVLLFGEGYSRAGLSLAILSVAYTMAAYKVIFMTALQAIGETGVFIKIGLATMITQTVLVTLLAPIIGMLGPTLARTAMYFVGFICLLYELRRRIDFEVDTGAIKKAVLASLLMAVPVSIVEGVLKNLLVAPYRFALDFFLGVVLYTFFALLLRLLEKKDVVLLRRIAPKAASPVLDLLERVTLDH